MGRFVVFILGFGLLAYVGYRFLYTRVAADGPAEAPAQALERVQDKADDLEQQLQQRADEAARERPE